MNTTIFNAQSTFYFVSAENKMLKKEIMEDASSRFSNKVNVNSYVITAGELIHDSEILLSELKDKTLEEFEIACIIDKEESVAVAFLGYDDKKNFLEILPTEKSSGIAAEKILLKAQLTQLIKQRLMSIKRRGDYIND